MIKPRELNNWMSQVKNPETELEDYDFIEKAVHGGKNGNKGLANFGAHLAVYEENGEKIVDEGLVERLDQVQQEYESVKKRERFQNIAQRIKNQEESGHQLLEDMLEDYKINTIDQKLDNLIRLNGGEQLMTEEYEDPSDFMAAVEEGEVESYDDVVNYVEDEEMGDEAVAMFLGEAYKTMAAQDLTEAQNSVGAAYEFKLATDELVEELGSQFEDLREAYIQDMNDQAASHRARGEQAQEISETANDISENLRGLNDDVSQTLEDSGVDELSSLRDSLGHSDEETEE